MYKSGKHLSGHISLSTMSYIKKKWSLKLAVSTADNASKNLKIVSVFSLMISKIGHKVYSKNTFMEYQK